MSFRQEVKGKKVLVFGLGLQGGGLGDALWLYQQGASVRVTDQKDEGVLQASLSKLPSAIERSLGSPKPEDFTWADLIIKNPGVPDDHPMLQIALKRGVPVLTSIAVFVREGREKVIGITGTRGKSTTTELTFKVLNTAFPGQVLIGGNLPGTSGLSLLDGLESAKYAVLELSSFQLHNFHDLKVSPHVAVVTNLYPDHLNRYPSLAEYQEDKRAIVAYQTNADFAIGNANNQGSQEIVNSSPSHKLFFKVSDVPSHWNVKIPGAHNLANIAAVTHIAKVLNIKEELVKKEVEDFHGLPFRLQNLGAKNGIAYINDTTASTPVAAKIAVEAMTGPTAIIVGGQTKNLPFDVFLDALCSSPHIKKIIILGSRELTDFTSSLKNKCGGKIAGQVFSMAEAVSLASQSIGEGGTVLLSPGFTSFDLFPNEFERGRQFSQAYEKL